MDHPLATARPAAVFVAESIRRQRYLLVATMIDSARVRPTRKAVRELMPRGQRRTHFSAEGDRSRRRILDAFCRMEVAVVVVEGLPDAFAWSYGAGGDWLRRMRPLIAAVSP